MTEQRFPRRFGRYILLDKVNSGGMAEVYRARVTGHDNFRRLVAIKCMLPALAADEEFTTMFVDEARLAAQLNHGNIVQIYELGRYEKRLYIAMELVQGHDLRATTRRARKMGKRLGVGFVAYIICRAAEALDYAHNKLSLDGTPFNLVHRDVSPQNILVSYDGEVKMVDFGIAKAEHRATETKAGTLKGKFAYMAPEQVLGEPTDRRADIFALGAVLFEGATGRPLFHGDTDMAILEKVRGAEIPNLEEQLAHAPAQLCKVIRKACSREPDDRYQSALDLADDLSPVLISRGNLFGPKNARMTMRVLYADEWQALPEQMRQYASIELEDKDSSPHSTEVLGALLPGTGDVPSLEDALASAKYERMDGTRSLTPKAEEGPQSSRPENEMSSAPTPMPRESSTRSGGGPRKPVPFDSMYGDVKTETNAPPSALARSERDTSKLSGARIRVDPRSVSSRPFNGHEEDNARAPNNIHYALFGLLGVCVVVIVILIAVLVSRGSPREIDDTVVPLSEIPTERVLDGSREPVQTDK